MSKYRPVIGVVLTDRYSTQDQEQMGSSVDVDC